MKRAASSQRMNVRSRHRAESPARGRRRRKRRRDVCRAFTSRVRHSERGFLHGAARPRVHRELEHTFATPLYPLPAQLSEIVSICGNRAVCSHAHFVQIVTRGERYAATPTPAAFSARSCRLPVATPLTRRGVMGPNRQRLKRGVSCALVVFATFLIFGVGAASPNTKGEHCVGIDGTDLNEFYGVSETIVAPFCTSLGTGEHWTTTNRWFVAPSYGKVPKGFVPAPGSTPASDFLAKFVGVRYVIDAGTAQEQTYVFANSDKLFTRLVEGATLFNPITLGTLHPLSAGQH